MCPTLLWRSGDMVTFGSVSDYVFVFQDLGVTGVFAFMWLVSSAAWAKGLSDVKTATDPDKVVTLIAACDAEENRCREVHDPVMSGLNTSVVSLKFFERYTVTQQTTTTDSLLFAFCFFQAFGFINLVLWTGNLWFVFKETGIIAPFMRPPPPPQEKPAAPDAYGQQGAYEQDPYASNQGGYQPDYSQQGYNQVAPAENNHGGLKEQL